MFCTDNIENIHNWQNHSHWWLPFFICYYNKRSLCVSNCKHFITMSIKIAYKVNVYTFIILTLG